jgi:hypothetical protein
MADWFHEGAFKPPYVPPTPAAPVRAVQAVARPVAPALDPGDVLADPRPNDTVDEDYGVCPCCNSRIVYRQGADGVTRRSEHGCQERIASRHMRPSLAPWEKGSLPAWISWP